MYERFFNLREKPFKLVPDPDYFYLSPSHARALTHLAYALDQGDGFVLISGEVGTGKTTLCRCFLAGLGDECETAYIFNTQLDSMQLLTAICHEFGIKITGGDGSQELLNVLNRFLMAQHGQDRKVILLIDEAQNLSVESLEMVRLLSNLETTRHKLLHIVLVGQPELVTTLERHNLRQLAQRISLRCQLMLLNPAQTRSFIEHRVQVASKILSHTLFTAGACRVIHTFAQGVPRRINIAADRALLLAYEQQQVSVTAAIARQAIQDLRVAHSEKGKKKAWMTGAIMIAGVVLLVILVIMTINKGPRGWIVSAMRAWNSDPEQSGMAAENELAGPVAIREPAATPSAPMDEPLALHSARHTDMRPVMHPVPRPAATPESSDTGIEEFAFAPDPAPASTIKSAPPGDGGPQSVGEDVNPLHAPSSRWDALTRLLVLWQQPTPQTDQLPDTMGNRQYFQIAARQYGLRLLEVNDDWPMIRRLNLPGIVALGTTAQGATVFGTLTRWQADTVSLALGDLSEVAVDFPILQSLVSGPVYVFWYNGLPADGIISQRSQGESVVRLKELLRSIGYYHLSHSPVFDPPTYHAIVDFQLQQSIHPDGLVGPITKILLINAAKPEVCPQLTPVVMDDDPS